MSDDEEDLVLKKSSPTEEEAKQKVDEVKAKIQEQMAKKKLEEERAKEEAERKAREEEVARKAREEARKKEEEEKRASEEVKVDQEGHSKQAINEDIPRVLVIGDPAVGKSTFIQQMTNDHHKRVAIGPTKLVHYYDRNGRF